MEKSYPTIISNNPMYYVECALSLEILEYHNKNFLAYNDDKSISNYKVEICLYEISFQSKQ